MLALNRLRMSPSAPTRYLLKFQVGNPVPLLEPEILGLRSHLVRTSWPLRESYFVFVVTNCSRIALIILLLEKIITRIL